MEVELPRDGNRGSERTEAAVSDTPLLNTRGAPVLNTRGAALLASLLAGTLVHEPGAPVAF
jgi:hypothetical protein